MSELRKNIEALIKSDITAYRISKDTGISLSVVQKILNKTSKLDNVSLKNAEILSDYWMENKSKELDEMKNVYFKNIDTGVVKNQYEWHQEAIEFFTNKYNEDLDLQEEFKTVNEYLEWADKRGYFYTDLVECDSDGNPIEVE